MPFARFSIITKSLIRLKTEPEVGTGSFPNTVSILWECGKRFWLEEKGISRIKPQPDKLTTVWKINIIKTRTQRDRRGNK